MSYRSGVPVISVITVCRNAEATIARTLQSVASQQGLDGEIEHVVVDGASTDGTMEVVRGFTHVGKTISEPDEGIADAFNKGMKLASGQYLLYLNADDWLHDDLVLRDALAFIRGQGEPDWVVGEVSEDRNCRLVKTVKAHPPTCWGQMLRNRISHPAVLLKREVLQEVDGFDVSFRIAMDFDLWRRLCVRHVKPTHWPRVVSVFSLAGVSSMGGARRDEERRAVMRRARDTPFKCIVGALYDAYRRMYA